MRPPRRWMVWMVVLGTGAGVVWPTHPAIAGPAQRMVLPAESPNDQSGEPDTPTGPGQRQDSWPGGHVFLALFASPQLVRCELRCADAMAAVAWQWVAPSVDGNR